MTEMLLSDESTEKAELRIQMCREKYSWTLDLSDMGLDYIPEEINELKCSLRVLKLSENNLVELPEFICSFTHLESIDLGYNRLSSLPEEIGNLDSLQMLDVRCNKLNAIPESIGKLTLLNTLDISYNHLTDLPETINKLKLLEHCCIKGNTLRIVPEKIAALDKQKKYNLLGHMEQIVELTGKYGLSEEYSLIVKPHLDLVCQRLHITPVQAVLFSHIVSEFDGAPVRMQEIARALNCNRMKIMQHMNDFDELQCKKLIRPRKQSERYNSTDAYDYSIPKEVMACLMKDQEYQPINQSNLEITELFVRIWSVFERRIDDDEISYDEMASDIMDLLNDNKHLPFVKKVFEYNFSKDNMMMLLRFCHYHVNRDIEEMDLRNIAQIFDHHSQFALHQRKFKEGEHPLMTCNLVENVNSGGFGDREAFKLTHKARNELLADLKLKMSRKCKDIVRACTINEKKLFYNDKEAEQITVFSSLLGIDSFDEIQKRLSESKMRTGFACLFSGPPGTGKTETVYQIARLTGRDIMMVDISETKSMWFGESEKIIKEIFTRYRNYVEDAEITPILFFNEADAVIGKRKTVASSTVAQTENTIQNIILQELENLNGILIATTNLTQNMDKAFERRFLYKIEFKKPGLAVRQSIWQSMIPSLSGDDAKEIASRYDFSGGQIENIVRKRTVEMVLSRLEPDLEKLISFCREELLEEGSSKKIGF